MTNFYNDLHSEVSKKNDNSIYVDGIDIRLVIFEPNALFSNSKLSTSSGKHLEDISHGHIVSLMYKLITGTRETDDLSVGSDRDLEKSKQELTNKQKHKRFIPC